LNKDILLTSPQPVKTLDSTAISLYLAEDTLKTPLPFKFIKDSLAWRTYRIAFPWESETSYTLEIDSAACINIYGISSKKLSTTFKTRPRDYYGTINLELTGVESQVVVQLLENTDAEKVLQEKIVNENGTAVFEYLAPEKYKVKVIFDENGDGRWNTGSYQDRVQPERVAYINEVIKVRSNWDNNLSWDLKPDPTFTKNIRDKELEEQLRKEAEEKARQESEQQFNTGQQQNDMFQPGGMSPGSMQPGR
jgi:hypothetical protein